jgi:hypothetical protein
MGRNYSNYQRSQLRQLVIEAEIQRFPRPEARAYVISKFGQDISFETLDKIKANIKKSSLARLNKLKKSRTAFIDQYFQRIDEILKYQQTQWEIYHRNAHSGLIQKLCVQELHALTITLTNLYDSLPAISEYVVGAEGIISEDKPSEGEQTTQEDSGLA